MSWAGAWGRALRDAVSDPFQEATGIPVSHVVNIGLRLPEELLEALQGGHRPPFDVVWSNSVPALRCARAGFCDELSEESVPTLGELPRRARPEGAAGWPVVMAYVVHYVLSYREALFAKPPDSWEVVLDPRFRGRVALYPGGNGFFPIAQRLGGGSLAAIPDDMGPCWDFFTRLKPQVGQLDYSIGMPELIRRGEVDLCFRALPNAVEFQRQGLGMSWSTPREGITDTCDALWIPRNVPPETSYWAQRYVDFALSKEVQESWCERLGAVPMHPEARLSPILTENDAFPSSADADDGRVLPLSESVKLEFESRWEQEFDRIFSS